MAASSLFVVVVLAGALHATKPLEAPGSAAPPASVQVICSQFDPRQPHTPAEMQAYRDCVEAQKLEHDLEDIRAKANAIPPEMIAFAAAAAGAFLTFLGTLLTTFFNRGVSFAQLYDQRASDRQKHNAVLIEQLSGSSSPLQMIAAATLIARIKTLRTARRRGGGKTIAQEEFAYLSSVVIAALSDDQLPHRVGKYLADNLVDALDLRKRRFSTKRKSLLSQHDLQHAQLRNVYWAGIDGRGIDFFGANLTGTSLRGADLRKAVFFNADLTGAVLKNANLQGAYFRGANLKGADLSGADLTGVQHLADAQFGDDTVWDARTKWPAGFTPPERN